MAEQVITHPISFDSALHPQFMGLGIPFRVRLPIEEIDLPVSLHLAGVYQYRVLNAGLNRLAAPTDDALTGELLEALSDTLAGREDLFGLPEQLLLRGGTLRFAVEQRLGDGWRERWGIALQSLVFTDCRMFQEDREKLDRLLRGERDPEPEAPAPESAGAETHSVSAAPGKKLGPSQADMQKALAELNARRKAQTDSWKK